MLQSLLGTLEKAKTLNVSAELARSDRREVRISKKYMSPAEVDGD